MPMSPSRPGASRGIPRVAIIATVVAALVLVGVLVAISATGGKDSTGSGKLTGVDEAKALFAGLPQQGDRVGAANAPVEIVEYADLQCPFCAEAAKRTVPTLVTDFVKPGTAKLTLRPLAFIGADSDRGALAVAAAGSQGQMWTYVEVLYRNQGRENSGWLTDKVAREAATALGLDIARFDSDRRGSGARSLLDTAAAAAQAAGVNSTPTFVVTGPKGRVVISDFTNLGEFRSAIASVR